MPFLAHFSSICTHRSDDVDNNSSIVNNQPRNKYANARHNKVRPSDGGVDDKIVNNGAAEVHVKTVKTPNALYRCMDRVCCCGCSMARESTRSERSDGNLHEEENQTKVPSCFPKWLTKRYEF